jgi:hypothetical protein
MVKDIFGREVKIGDYITYSPKYASYIVIDEVRKINDINGVMVVKVKKSSDIVFEKTFLIINEIAEKYLEYFI